jgi:hypothetical protein
VAIEAEERMGRRFEELDFDALYSAFWESGDIERDAKAAIRRLVLRQVRGPNAAMDVGQAVETGVAPRKSR